jgi:hypothetical protein
VGVLSFMGALRSRSIIMTSAEKQATYAARAKLFDAAPRGLHSGTIPR